MSTEHALVSPADLVAKADQRDTALGACFTANAARARFLAHDLELVGVLSAACKHHPNANRDQCVDLARSLVIATSRTLSGARRRTVDLIRPIELVQRLALAPEPDADLARNLLTEVGRSRQSMHMDANGLTPDAAPEHQRLLEVLERIAALVYVLASSSSADTASESERSPSSANSAIGGAVEALRSEIRQLVTHNDELRLAAQEAAEWVGHVELQLRRLGVERDRLAADLRLALDELKSARARIAELEGIEIALGGHAGAVGWDRDSLRGYSGSARRSAGGLGWWATMTAGVAASIAGTLIVHGVAQEDATPPPAPPAVSVDVDIEVVEGLLSALERIAARCDHLDEVVDAQLPPAE